MTTDSSRPGLEERMARGREARARVPPSSHAGWQPAAGRPDPVALVEEQNLLRDQDLVPVRHGRMVASPFTFYRGAAKIMAVDLAETPTAGLEVQLCGDAHLSNFGVFGSPERRLVFDINDFDETLPGPFEYDVKRLAASLAVAAHHNGFAESEARAISARSVRAYREAMAGFAAMRTLDVWYASLSEADIAESAGVLLTRAKKGKKKGKKKVRGSGRTSLSPKQAKKLEKRMQKNARKARSRNSLQALSKLTEVVDGQRRISSDPPVLVPARELHATYGFDPEQTGEMIRAQLLDYRSTLQLDRRRLLERFEVVDWARKVVGVGSVGTRAFIVLLQGRDQDDPLFLQVKEATRSVLEGGPRTSRFEQAGERVVQGQRLMQASSDTFLGWTRGVEAGRFYYWRQLRDMKGSVLVERLPPGPMSYYAGICGWTLARAHARTGDPVAIAAYLGEDDSFDASISDFSARYAERNERDYADFAHAISTGRIEAVEGV